MDIRIIGCALLFLVATTPAVPGEIQRWVDQDGHVHFGDIAPLDTDTTQLKPEIITTAPSHKSLKEILRPGETRMLKSYEQRGLRVRKAKNNSLKQDKRNKSKIALEENRCQQHQQKKEALASKLRHGLKPSQQRSTETKLAREQLLIEQYCN